MMLTSATNFNDVSRETNDGRGGLQGGAIAAIVVGAMLAVLVVVEMVVGACVARRRYVDGGGGFFMIGWLGLLCLLKLLHKV